MAWELCLSSAAEVRPGGATALGRKVCWSLPLGRAALRPPLLHCHGSPAPLGVLTGGVLDVDVVARIRGPGSRVGLQRYPL